MSSKRLTRVSTPRPLRGPMHRVVSGSLSPGRPQPFTKSARLPIWVFSQSFKPRSSRALVDPQDQAGVVGDDHGLVDQVDQPLVQLVLTQRRDPLSQTFNQRRDTLAVLVDEGVGLPRYRVQHPAGAVVDRQGDGERRALRVADRPEPVRRLAPLGVGLGHVAHHQDAAAAMSRAADGGAEHARGQRARLIEGLARLGIVQRLHIIVLDGERVRRAIFHVRILREWPQHLARIGVVSMIAGAVRSD